MGKATRLLVCGVSVFLMLVSSRAQQGAQSAQPRIELSSGDADSRVVYRVRPEYPANARVGHIEGPVTLRIIVSRDGTVQKLTPMVGNPFLLMSAMSAVRQWRYKPYVVNGAPVEFQSSVTLKFML